MNAHLPNLLWSTDFGNSIGIYTNSSSAQVPNVMPRRLGGLICMVAIVLEFFVFIGMFNTADCWRFHG